MSEKIVRLRIHGDNILECETALELIFEVINPTCSKPIFRKSAAYSPVYEITDSEGLVFRVQLFPGYGRWQFDIAKYLSTKGASLREAADAVITRLIEEDGNSFETPVLALEFCGALPAGNNAWQRCGRALSLAYAKVPYLYFAELGGLELDSERKIKAPRFPNPLIPFAYLVLGKEEDVLSLPVYTPSPSINNDLANDFNDYFGQEDAKILIKKVLLGGDDDTSKLQWKAERIVEILAGKRKGSGILAPKDWAILAKQNSGIEKAEWLIKKKMPWNKKVSIESTNTFKKLLALTMKIGAVAAGSKDMPICLVDKSKRSAYSKKLKTLYKGKLSDSFSDWVADSSGPLLCVWVAGFKPRGDDSRPDRGLVPLARMIFGRQVDILTIIYGPAKPAAFVQLKTNMSLLAKTNGLWESVINLSSALLVDSKTNKKADDLGFVIENIKKEAAEFLLPASSEIPTFGEHDVDSVLHLIFSDSNADGVYESICNPPGGDWSGISIIDFATGTEYRWTSLPRVSGVEAKRPDHLVQFEFNNSFLAIESKEKYATLEKEIGPRLEKYAKDLIVKNSPISHRANKQAKWETFSDSLTKNDHSFYSGAAFIFSNEEEMKKALIESEVDIVVGVEFIPNSIETKLHILTSEEGAVFVDFIKKRILKFAGSISVHVH
ncbi:MAG: hypothetical protein WC120_00525 [Parcubacteria group bacterium]